MEGGIKINIFRNIFTQKKRPLEDNTIKHTESSTKTTSSAIGNEEVAIRKGEIGEYKIDIQLSTLPKEYIYLSDIFIENVKSSTGYSQIDHVIMTQYGLFIIETKNYQGTIYGEKDRKTWVINGKFKMMNPIIQNYGHMQAIKNLIDLNYHDHFISIVSFTKRCTLKISTELRKISSETLVIYDVELSEFINRKIAILKLQHQKPIFSEFEVQSIYNTLLTANIADQNIRKQHINSINTKLDADDNKCVICQKDVSEKVKLFCKSNKKFKGEIYCYEHQRNLS